MTFNLLETTDTQIIRIAEALYNLRPGNVYLNNFRNFVSEYNIDDFANAIGSNFSSLSDTALATLVANNLELDGEAETAAISYLTGQFAANANSRGKVVLDSMNMFTTLTDHAVFGSYATKYNTDVMASLTYSDIASNTEIAASDSSNDVVSGATYTMTGGVINGTEGSDVFIGAIGSMDITTINSGSGDDIMRVNVEAGIDNQSTLYTTDLEDVYIRVLDDSNGETTIDLSEANGLVNLWSNRSEESLKLTGGTNVTYGIKDTASKLTVVEGTATTNMVLDTVSGSQVVIDTTTTLAINSTGSDNSIDIDTADVTNEFNTINVSGSADLDIGTLNAEVSTLNGTGFTGGITATFNTNSVDKSITGGSGNDVITITGNGDDNIEAGDGDDNIIMGATMNGDDMVNGGNGDDTLVISMSTGATKTISTVTDVEIIQVNSAITEVNATNVTNTIDVSDVSGGDIRVSATITDEDTSSAENNIQLVTNLQAGTNVSIIGNLSDDDADSHILQAVLEDATGTTDSLTVGLFSDDSNNQTIEGLVVADVETVTIAVAADETNDNVDTVTLGSVSIDGATAMVVTSEEDVVIAFAANDSLDTINLSGATAGIDVDVDTAGDDTGIEFILANPSLVTDVIALTLHSSEGVRDIITFGDTMISAVTITNFTNGSSVVSDILDVSGYGIVNISDFTFADTGADVTIDVADDDNFGLITLAGIANISDLTADNFTFA
jgi:hypothetical protein